MKKKQFRNSGYSEAYLPKSQPWYYLLRPTNPVYPRRETDEVRTCEDEVLSQRQKDGTEEASMAQDWDRNKGTTIFQGLIS